MRIKPFRPEEASRILRERASGLPGTVGVCMTDLISGLWASYNPTALFYGASTVKVPIAMTVLWLVDHNRLTLQETIAYQPSDYATGTGTLQGSIRPGDRLSVARLLDLMITVSDNIARNMLERFIGAGTIRQYMASVGVPSAYSPTERSVTPCGMNQILVALESGGADLSTQSTLFLLDLMQRTTHRSRIPRYLPRGAQVANKIGTWPGQVHDIGVVYAPDIFSSIAIFMKGIPEAQAEDAIGRIAQAIYEYEASLRQP